MTEEEEPEEIVWQGKFVTAKKRGRWEYVSRARGIRAAAILAIENGHILLVEQYRVPLGKRCLELPAGLIGDQDDPHEEELSAAGRELEEETGWRAETLEAFGEFYSSPGMVSEHFTLVRARPHPRRARRRDRERGHRGSPRSPCPTSGIRRKSPPRGRRGRRSNNGFAAGGRIVMAAKGNGRVAGKLALVTGAAQGLGAAHCQALAREGAQATAAAINAQVGAGTAFAMQHDVTSPEQWDQAIELAADALGGLSVLVNNAGVGVRGNIETCTLEEWRRGFAINVESVFLGCQKALPLMKDNQPGSIVNISSIAGLIASDTMPGYNASKAAVWMLSKSVALYCAKMGWNIRSNSVHPTFVDTPILDGMVASTGREKSVIMDKLARQIPLKRVGAPREIADGVLFLASDESSFMTGAELRLDGGISAM
jgi:NAD(P)-dependent dehydrogenase (short-subunit alcohol dehydrogenase family)/ADP-ribose pyrophosphatase YjhB (NUDIX family)